MLLTNDDRITIIWYQAPTSAQSRTCSLGALWLISFLFASSIYIILKHTFFHKIRLDRKRFRSWTTWTTWSKQFHKRYLILSQAYNNEHKIKTIRYVISKYLYGILVNNEHRINTKGKKIPIMYYTPVQAFIAWNNNTYSESTKTQNKLNCLKIRNICVYWRI